MRPDRVVVATPAFDEDLGLAQRGEDLAVQQLISELAVERRAVLHTQGSLGADRTLAGVLQHGTAAQLAGIPATGPGNSAAKRGTTESANSCVN